MKKTLFLLAILNTAIGSAIAQNEVKYKKLFYKDLIIENNDLSILIEDAVSTDAETKFKIKIVNKTADFIIYKPEESTFIINGQEMKPVERWLIIEPNESSHKVINLKGSLFNSLKNYSFELNGLYKVSTNSKGISTPDYKLPVANNDFKTGNFTVSLNKLDKETDATRLKLNIMYDGDKMGIIFPGKVSVIMPNGTEHAVVKSSKLSSILLKKGQTETVSLNWDRMQGGKEMDMQKVDMNVKFNGMFTESDLKKLKTEKFSMEFDELISNEKGK